MKKILFAASIAVCAAVFAAETKSGEKPKYVDPVKYADYTLAMQDTAETPFAVSWSQKHDDAIKAATTDEVLAACVADAESAAALLAKIKPAYASDPLVLTQIAAVTQWVMLNDPWYCLLWNGPHAAGRAIWQAALARKIAESEDDYIRTFCRQQLDLCK